MTWRIPGFSALPKNVTIVSISAIHQASAGVPTTTNQIFLDISDNSNSESSPAAAWSTGQTTTTFTPVNVYRNTAAAKLAITFRTIVNHSSSRQLQIQKLLITYKY